MGTTTLTGPPPGRSRAEIITSSLSGPLCGRVQNWDDHAVNQHVFDAMRFRTAAYDQAVTALIEDIYARGLDGECWWW